MRYFISLLGLAVVVGVGYFTVAQYVSVAHGQSDLTPVQVSGTSPDGAQVLALLSRLQSIQLDGSIFQNQNFASLQDWSVSIAPQQVGRTNPYLQSSGIAPASSSSPKVSLPKKTK